MLNEKAQQEADEDGYVAEVVTHKPNQEGIVVISLDDIIFFTLSKSDFSTHYMSFDECSADTDSLPICGMAMVADHKNQFYKQTGDFGEKKHIVLTGHKDGSVLIWKCF